MGLGGLLREGQSRRCLNATGHAGKIGGRDAGVSKCVIFFLTVRESGAHWPGIHVSSNPSLVLPAALVVCWQYTHLL